MADEGEGELVVNVEHLMAYVNEQKEEGNVAYKAGKTTAALEAWQRGLDAMGQAEGRPMRRDDVQLVLLMRSVLHNNRGQALMRAEFWRRAILEFDEAVRIDPANVKALWRRHRAHRALKAWAEALADAETLLSDDMRERAGPVLEQMGLTPAKLRAARDEIAVARAEADRVAEETFDDRAEEAAAKGLHELRGKFEEVTRRCGLHGNAALAEEITELITRPGGATAAYVAAVYQIDEDDAQARATWQSLLRRSPPRVNLEVAARDAHGGAAG